MNMFLSVPPAAAHTIVCKERLGYLSAAMYSVRSEPPESWPQGIPGRLMTTMAEVASERGYAATRVRDVLEQTGISRRTFYKYFVDRDDCFFTTYDAIVGDIAGLIGAGADSPQADLEATLAEVLAHFSAWPSHAWVFLVEILAAGPTGARLNEQSMSMLATRLASCRGWQPGSCDSLERPDAAQAVVGAIVRIVQRGLVHDGGSRLASLRPSLVVLTTRLALVA
jgi:AcrR family transcriptional regulator